MDNITIWIIVWLSGYILSVILFDKLKSSKVLLKYLEERTMFNSNFIIVTLSLITWFMVVLLIVVSIEQWYVNYKLKKVFKLLDKVTNSIKTRILKEGKEIPQEVIDLDNMIRDLLNKT